MDIQYRRGEENIVADAVSRRPDFLGFVQHQTHTDWVDHMLPYLTSGHLPTNANMKRTILGQKDRFNVQDGILYRRIDSEGSAPYIEQPFRAHFLEGMHKEYRHVGYSGLYGVVHYQGWWPGIERNIRKYVECCPNCHTSQR